MARDGEGGNKSVNSFSPGIQSAINQIDLMATNCGC